MSTRADRAPCFGRAEPPVARLHIGCMNETTPCLSRPNGPEKDDVIESKTFGFFATNPNERGGSAPRFGTKNGDHFEKTSALSPGYDM